ncbi:MAG: 3-hydroxyacyl-CoA dehydrogenase [Candidatus Bathyarchaeum tardum]|nr:MAG: 3-hydroxyacyl-CoA dehydrogenase [Candidatus Bathyarchaeum tardum]
MRKTADTNIQRVAVIGTGLMGHGIAQCFAVNGFDVTLLSRNKANLENAVQNIEWSLSKLAEKGSMSQEDMQTALSRIRTSDSYREGLLDVDLVVESVSENMQLKKQIFSKIDKYAPLHAIIASNTSALSVTEIGRATKKPEKTVGMHWFIPPPLINLIEVIKGNDTNTATLNATMNVGKKLGKTPILCKKDARGFIVSRILVSVFNEAFWTYTRKEATIEEIDSAIKYCGRFPMGWFELIDFVGVDIEHDVSKILHEAHGKRFYPHLKITEPLIELNNLGKKTGQGFYDWNKGRPEIPEKLEGKYNVNRSWAVAVNEATWIIFEGIADPKSIDLGMKLGTGWTYGPCEYADIQGLDNVLDTLESAYDQFSIELYKPCPMLKKYVEKGWTGKKARKGFHGYK